MVFRKPSSLLAATAAFARDLVPNVFRQLYLSIRNIPQTEERKVPILRRSSRDVYIIALHAFPILGAVVTATINLLNLWVGKDIGHRGQIGQKQFALQMAAKLQEILAVASLTDIIMSPILKRLSMGDGLPLGATTAGLRFSEASYLWSEDFVATCSAKFSGKYLLIISIVVASLLSLTVGPASATAMTPKQSDWLAGQVQFAMNVSAENMWPSTLDISDSQSTCTSVAMSCSPQSTWDILASTLFAYWGHQTLGGMYAMPETAIIPSGSSTRTLNVRFKGSLNLYQPEVTVATTQPAVIADVVNVFRWIWFRAHANRCIKNKYSGWCYYQDIQWTVPSLQPSVYVACNPIDAGATVEFPIISVGETNITLAPYPAQLSASLSHTASDLKWLTLDDPSFADTSIGVIVHPAREFAPPDGIAYACAIKGQWAKSDVSTSFLNEAYNVNGAPPFFFAPEAGGSTYRGTTVKMTPSWAAQINSPVAPNSTLPLPFDTLLAAGSRTSTKAKVEAILSVLITERMAQIHAEGSLLGTLPSWDGLLQTHGDAMSLPSPLPASSGTFIFRTTVTGYSYGLRPGAMLSASSLLAIVILLIYAGIATTHLLHVILCERRYVSSWRDIKDLVALALQSPGLKTESISCGVNTLDLLRRRVAVLRSEDGRRAELEVDAKDGGGAWAKGWEGRRLVAEEEYD